MKYVIVDVDGTVALRGDRSPFDWDRVGEDLPNVPVIEVIQGLHDAGFAIIFMSGRKERCRRATIEWIDEHIDLGLDRLLFMRRDGDVRPDEIVKRGIYETEVFPERGRPVAVFDDRNKVVKMWRSLGLCVMHVCDFETGDF